MPYLNKQALQGLKHYSYKPGGYTIIDNWHTPHWNYVVENIVPAWLAPNVITLLGLTAVMLGNAVAVYYSPSLTGFAPRWVCGLLAFAQFFYLHMDCLDGKQARRTGSSSPLGQLFDHGCDAVVVQFVVAMLAVTLAMGPCWLLWLGNLVVFTPFILAHWEEYHTGTMTYGNGVWGVTEANYAVVVLHTVSAAAGPQVWHTLLLRGLGLEPAVAGAAWLPEAVRAFLLQLTLQQAAVLGLAVMGSLMISEQITRVFFPDAKALEALQQHAAEADDHRQLGRSVAASHLLQLLLFLAAGGALVAQPESRAGPIRVRMATFGTAYALVNTRLIMAHMSKVPFNLTAWPLAAQALQLGNALLPAGPALDPTALAWAVAIVTVAGYLHCTISMVREICAFLGIHALHLTPAQIALKKQHKE